MLEFFKEDDGEGFFSVHVKDKGESELLAMCPSERHSDVLLSVLRAFHGGSNDRSKEMETDQTSTYKETSTSETSTAQAEEAVNETSLIKLTTNRNGLRLISSNY